MRLDGKVMEMCVSQPQRLHGQMSIGFWCGRSGSSMFALPKLPSLSLAAPLLELCLDGKSPKHLSPCLIDCISILTPNDIFWLACLDSFITLTSEWQHCPEIKATIIGSFSSLSKIVLCNIKYYINLAKENVLKALKIIQRKRKQWQLEQLQHHWTTYIVFIYR